MNKITEYTNPEDIFESGIIERERKQNYGMILKEYLKETETRLINLCNGERGLLGCAYDFALKILGVDMTARRAKRIVNIAEKKLDELKQLNKMLYDTLQKERAELGGYELLAESRNAHADGQIPEMSVYKTLHPETIKLRKEMIEALEDKYKSNVNYYNDLKGGVEFLQGTMNTREKFKDISDIVEAA